MAPTSQMWAPSWMGISRHRLWTIISQEVRNLIYLSISVYVAVEG